MQNLLLLLQMLLSLSKGNMDDIIATCPNDCNTLVVVDSTMALLADAKDKHIGVCKSMHASAEMVGYGIGHNWPLRASWSAGIAGNSREANHTDFPLTCSEHYSGVDEQCSPGGKLGWHVNSCKT